MDALSNSLLGQSGMVVNCDDVSGGRPILWQSIYSCPSGQTKAEQARIKRNNAMWMNRSLRMVAISVPRKEHPRVRSNVVRGATRNRGGHCSLVLAGLCLSARDIDNESARVARCERKRERKFVKVDSRRQPYLLPGHTLTIRFLHAFPR